MRFKGMTPSGRDKEINVYNFTVGTSELVILRDMLQEWAKRTPKTIFTMMLRGRIENMLSQTNKALRDNGIHVQPGGRSPKSLGEALDGDADGFIDDRHIKKPRVFKDPKFGQLAPVE